MLWGFPTFQTRSLDPLWWMKILKQNHSFQALIYLVHLIFLEYSAKIIYLINTSWCIDRMITFFLIFIFTLFYFTILYWFCHTLTWIHHGYTCVPKLLISCEILTVASKKTEQTPPNFHELLWLFPAFQELSLTNLFSSTNNFSFLRSPLRCPHATLINVVRRVNGFVISH